MALTSEDLNQIKNIVETSESRLITSVETSESRLKKEILESMDRMESRINTAIGLLQRDTFSRLNDHDARIERLEKTLSR